MALSDLVLSPVIELSTQTNLCYYLHFLLHFFCCGVPDSHPNLFIAVHLDLAAAAHICHRAWFLAH